MNSFQKLYILAAVCCLAAIATSLPRNKREAYVLSDGIDSYLSIKPSFQCSSPGYFADIENNCNLFHICLPLEFPDGKTEIAQYTFACGNQTVFNQFSLTCAHESESIPCASSADFFYLNERLSLDKQPLHTEEDLQKFAAAAGKA